MGAYCGAKFALAKRCPRCGEVKPRGEFGVRTNGWLESRCLLCRASARRDKYRTNPQRERANRARSRFFVVHGIREQDYEKMLAKQGGKCAICHQPPVAGRRLGIDHCHASNRIRGLLCDLCNRALGLFADNTANLQCAIDYLKTADSGLIHRSRLGIRSSSKKAVA